MRKLVTLALVGTLTGCDVAVVVHQGDGVAGHEVRDLDAFSAVRVASNVDVDVVPGDAPSADVQCDEDLLDDVATRVVDGELIVDTRDGDGADVAVIPHTDCRVVVTATGFDALTTTGSGSLHADGTAHADQLAITSTGSGDIVVEGVDGGTVELTTTGSGDVEVDGGDASAIDLTSTGSGDVLASAVVASSVDATLSGSGDAEVTATTSVRAALSGSGDLFVSGDPGDRQVNTTGSGDVLFD